jgi:hypothetical protein
MLQGTHLPLIAGSVALALIAALYVTSSARVADLRRQEDDPVAVDRSQGLVRQQLQYPEDAEFRDVHVSYLGGHGVVCGWVSPGTEERARFWRFVDAGAVGGLYFEDAAERDFSTIWRELCGR